MRRSRAVPEKILETWRYPEGDIRRIHLRSRDPGEIQIQQAYRQPKPQREELFFQDGSCTVKISAKCLEDSCMIVSAPPFL
jgi:hypothetical protein